MWTDEARKAAAEARGNKGVHSQGILSTIPNKYAAQLHAAFTGRTAAGQVNTNVGNVWQKVGKSGGSRARAESVARGLRVDNPDRLVRVR